MGFKTEIKVDGQWLTNALVFATIEEARDYAREKYSRWSQAKDSRAVEAPGETPNYQFKNGVLTKLQN